MTTYSENFNGPANGTAITVGTAGGMQLNWSVTSGVSYKVQGTGKVAKDTGSSYAGIALANVTIAGDNQSSQMECVATGASMGPVVRAAADGSQYCAAIGGNGGTTYLAWRDAAVSGGAWQLHGAGVAYNWQPGHLLRIEADTELRMYADITGTGSSFSLKDTWTINKFPGNTGVGFIQYAGSGTTARMDNWGGGDLPLANFIAVSAGYADVSSTWSNGVVPTSTDTILNIGANVTIRTPIVWAGITSVAADLIISGAAGGTLEITGTSLISFTNAGRLLGTGPGLFKFKGPVKFGTVDGATACYGEFLGTSVSSRFTLNGQSLGYFTTGGNSLGTGTGIVRGEFCQCTNVGNTAQPFAKPMQTAAGSPHLWWKSTVFDGCAPIIHQGALEASREHYMRDCSWINTVNCTGTGSGATDGTSAIIYSLASSTGARDFKRNVFDRLVYAPFANATVEDNIFLGDIRTHSTNAINWASFARNLVYGFESGHFNFDTTNNVFVSNAASGDHGPLLGILGSTTIHDGWIFDFPAGGGSSDGCFLTGTATLKNSIILPSATNEAQGSLSTMSIPGVTLSFLHNTSSALWLMDGEADVLGAGVIAAFKSNITWKPNGTSTAATTTYHIHSFQGGIANDTVLAANADYNCGYGLGTGLKGKGYDVPMTGTPGAHDLVNINPGFVDPYRTIKSWDASIAGGSGSTANALAELAKLNNSSGYNSAYSIANYRAYILAGYVPTNALLRNAGHDSVTMGALEGVFTAIPVIVHHTRQH